MKFSFIVIGRNEGFKIIKSIESIIRFAEHHSIKNYEIIYVDSNSNDGSLEKTVNTFKNIKIFKIIDYPNAAKARNLGAQNATGDILFFIDGDMELIESFPFKYILDSQINYVLFSGQLINLIYDKGFTNIIDNSLYYKNLKTVRHEDFFGGLFIIEKRLWEKHNGMDEKFKFGEDLDLSIRLKSSGFILTRFPDPLAHHHTSPKIYKNIFSSLKGSFYSRSLLYRKHIFDKNIYKRILKSDGTAIVLILSFFGLFFNYKLSISLYLTFVLSAVIYVYNNNYRKLPYRFIKQILRDFMVLSGFLFFFPIRTSSHSIQINDEK